MFGFRGGEPTGLLTRRSAASRWCPHSVGGVDGLSSVCCPPWRLRPSPASRTDGYRVEASANQGAPGPSRIGDGAPGHSAHAEATMIADALRRAHLIDGVPWSRMAVIVRSGCRALCGCRAAGASGPAVGGPLPAEPAGAAHECSAMADEDRRRPGAAPAHRAGGGGPGITSPAAPDSPNARPGRLRGGSATCWWRGARRRRAAIRSQGRGHCGVRADDRGAAPLRKSGWPGSAPHAMGCLAAVGSATPLAGGQRKW